MVLRLQKAQLMNSKEYFSPPSGTRAALIGFLAALGYLAVFSLTSCSTVAGAGRDVQKLGDEIEDAAH